MSSQVTFVMDKGKKGIEKDLTFGVSFLKIYFKFFFIKIILFFKRQFMISQLHALRYSLKKLKNSY